MNHKSNRIYQLSLLLSLVLSLVLSSGCAAVQVGADAAPRVVALGAAETIRGMQSVIRGDVGTFAMLDASERMVILAWPRGINYAFTAIGANGREADLNALKISAEGLALSAKSLANSGWRIIPVDEIPAAVGAAVMGYTVEAVMSGMNALPTIFVVPTIIFDDWSKPTNG